MAATCLCLSWQTFGTPSTLLATLSEADKCIQSLHRIHQDKDDSQGRRRG